MRRTYLVCYDIADPKRLRQTFKTCRNWGNHLQFSIFECDLNPSEKTTLETEIQSIIHSQEDQVLFVDLGPTQNRGNRLITALGNPYIRLDAPCFVA